MQKLLFTPTHRWAKLVRGKQRLLGFRIKVFNTLLHWYYNGIIHVSLSSSCVTRYSQTQQLKTFIKVKPFIISWFLQVRNLGEVLRGSSQDAGHLCSHLEIRKEKNPLPNSFRLLADLHACGCRAEDPSRCWLPGRGHSPLFTAILGSSPGGPSNVTTYLFSKRMAPREPSSKMES